jgi:23S rRNA (adenine2503-C2)-methyltransferase
MSGAGPALLGLPPDRLAAAVCALALPKFAHKQIGDWIYKKFARSFDEMSNISKSGRALLAAHCRVGASEPEAAAVSADGTKKYLFRTLENHCIESAYIPEDDRATLCLSVQAGCRMACRFCMTARQGLRGQLRCADILNQYYSLPERARVSNIVYMGMGEPLDNIEPVLASIAAFTAPWGMAMSPRRITVSTCGILEGLRRLLAETEVHIALSLHNPFDSERAALMPIAARESLEPIFDLLRSYNWRGQRRLTLEYILFEGYNDSDTHLKQLLRLVRGLADVRINLLRLNTQTGCLCATNGMDAEFFGCEQTGAVRASQRLCATNGTSLPRAAALSKIEDFQARLNAEGIIATIRRSRGEDIAAACGLLSTRYNNGVY